MTYTIGLEQYIQEQSADAGVSQITFDWGSAPTDLATMAALANEFYQALCATYAPGLLTSGDCTTQPGVGPWPACAIGNNGNQEGTFTSRCWASRST